MLIILQSKLVIISFIVNWKSLETFEVKELHLPSSYHCSGIGFVKYFFFIHIRRNVFCVKLTMENIRILRDKITDKVCFIHNVRNQVFLIFFSKHELTSKTRMQF